MNIAVKRYKQLVVHRYDDKPLVKYFSVSDFPGLVAESVSFKGPHGEKLNGFYYSNGAPKEGKLVVFCHGLGPGQKAYMTEIATLALKGYRVLVVDNVGCSMTEGEDTRGMSESLADLDAVLNQLDTKDEITVIGHSWGGFAVSNIRNFHPEIKKVVVISGFIEVEKLLSQSLHGFTAIIRKALMRYERKINPKFAMSSALTAFEDNGADVLWFHSRDDYMVSFEKSFAIAKEKIKSPRVEFIEFENKKHNPNYTVDAVSYLVSTFSKLNGELKDKPFEEQKAFMDTVDFRRMTAQDEEVWAKIFDLIER
ncbi:MAG: alpha/beta fold hydrolase [Bacilli bacterium]|nr:alpha/beta fold hydrolase [Bacilli bacterium]